jgi:O-phospho-L-seryl-tRNASec:L-selenocysteinyl-tRNA synthase
LLHELAMMDSNNYSGNVGVGEREGRVYSSLVSHRHFGLTHGIGRSGNLSENQPKAAGSSLMLVLANKLVMHAMKLSAGLALPENAQKSNVLQGHVCQLVPMATGMTIALVLSALKKDAKKRFVLWSRIDQKSALKAVRTAGLEPVVVPLFLDESTGTLRTDLSAMEAKIQELGAENVLCVLSTTSCFAPRVPDDVVGIAKLCKRHGMQHVVNNAYGV